MFVIWGSKKQRENLGLMSMNCPNCQTLRSFNVFEISSKFTLYYLPLFTYKRKQFAFCNSCGYLSETPKGMEDKIRDRIKKTAQKPVDREKEKKALAQILRSDPNNEMAWLSMAALVSVSNQKRECYVKVLKLNPENIQAKNGLLRLSAGEKQSSFNPPEKTENRKIEEGGWGKFLSILFFVVIGLASIFFIYEIASMVGGDRDVTNSQLWRSEKWGYEITFPAYWKSPKRNSFKIRGDGADIYCENHSSTEFSTYASSVVFVDGERGTMSLVRLGESLVKIIADETGAVEIISATEYSKNGVLYRKIIFDDQTGIIRHYTLVSHNGKIYFISSISSAEYFDIVEKDFDAIVASLIFFD